jgi:hypothetical protein
MHRNCECGVIVNVYGYDMGDFRRSDGLNLSDHMSWLDQLWSQGRRSRKVQRLKFAVLILLSKWSWISGTWSWFLECDNSIGIKSQPSFRDIWNADFHVIINFSLRHMGDRALCADLRESVHS